MSELMSVVFPVGFKVGAGRGGIKAQGDDVMVLAAETDCAAAAIFTTNKLCAAPVKYSRRVRDSGVARAVVANSGNANAATGQAGLSDAAEMARIAGQLVGCEAEKVFVGSTGVIGTPLPMDKVRAGTEAAWSNVAADEKAAAAASRAILTLDTHPKAAQREISVGGKAVRIGGIAKGAGMISPKMATMLAFITTDARIRAPLLQRSLEKAAEHSFHRVTVDGDMSTNDSVFLLASGMSQAGEITDGGDGHRAFEEAFSDLCLELAKMMAADGEGASKFVEVRVTGAADDEGALVQARAIANSKLVKTAIFGSDPNWGRVLAAAGYAGAPFDEEKAVLRFNGVKSFEKGTPAPLSDELHDAMKEKEILIELDLGLGGGRAVIYTCDLTYDYIRINAEYHT